MRFERLMVVELVMTRGIIAGKRESREDRLDKKRINIISHWALMLVERTVTLLNCFKVIRTNSLPSPTSSLKEVDVMNKDLGLRNDLKRR